MIVRLALVTLALTFGLLNSSVQAQSFKWDTQYLPSDSFITITLNAQRILGYEKKDSELRKYIEEKAEKFISLKIGEVDQLQLCFSGELQDGERFSRKGDGLLTVKLVFSKDQDLQEFFSKAFDGQEFEDAKHDGKSYKKQKNGGGPSVFHPNKRVLVIGEESGVKHVMEHENSMGGIVEQLKEADGNADVLIAYRNTKTLAQMISEIAEEAEGLPFDIKDIFGEAKHGYAIADFDSGKPLKLEVVAKDKEGAERLQRALDAIVGLGKVMIPEGRKQIERQMERFDKEGGPFDGAMKERMKEQMKLGLKMMDIFDSVLEGTATSVKQNVLVAETTVMGGMTEVVTLVGQQVASTMKMMEQFLKEAEAFDPEIQVDDIEVTEPAPVEE